MINDSLNLKDAIIKHTIKRLKCGLDPKPLYPCNKYKMINNLTDNSSIFDLNIYDKKDFDLYIKNLWNHFNKCKKCEHGVWYNYNKNKERK